MKTFTDECNELQEEIQLAYQQGVTMEEAEKLAARFLHAQMLVANELRVTDLDARMRKSGTKAVRAKVYLDAITGVEKKPTEGTLTALIDTNGLVSEEQNALDKAEAYRDQLKNYFDIFGNSHVYFRGIAKGNFSG